MAQDLQYRCVIKNQENMKKFDITKYNFADLAKLTDFVEKVWEKKLKLENQMDEGNWDLDYLYFQGIDFSRSNESGITVKFLAHDWNSPSEMTMTIPVEALVDWDSYKEKQLQEA